MDGRQSVEVCCCLQTNVKAGANFFCHSKIIKAEYFSFSRWSTIVKNAEDFDKPFLCSSPKLEPVVKVLESANLDS